MILKKYGGDYLKQKMKERKNKVIDLGNGFVYEKGEVKEVRTEKGEDNKEWMTWDEGWKWVIDSLKKIHGISGDTKARSEG